MSNVKIVSFNLRCVWKGDGINAFIFRAGMIYDKIMREMPDVLAFQEMTIDHLDLLKRMLPEYVFCGQFRSKNYAGEGIFTAVRKDVWDVIAYESFWISPTPYVPGSRFEDQSDCPRICAVTQIRHTKTGKMLRLYNIHLDHISEKARVLGTEATLEFIRAYNEKDTLPSVILGDFNAIPSSEAIALMNAQPDLCDVTADIPFTFHNYGKEQLKIDYIFLSRSLADKVVDVAAWTDEKSGIYLSDHYPVCATLEI